MKVSLIDHTGSGWPDPARRAAALLVFTKSTRLQMKPSLLDEIMTWPPEKMEEELSYMANTIPSSWEFCSYTFLIEGVTRAFTHQLVRTRTASFAQQTMRVLDVSEGPGWDYATGPTIPSIPNSDASYDNLTSHQEECMSIYHGNMKDTAIDYKRLIANGAAIEDARGILPTNILTNIVMKINLRNWVDMIRKRSSSRTQGEYRDVLEAMKEAVLEVHPWAILFIDRTADRAIADLEKFLKEWQETGDITPMQKNTAVKLLDQLRAQS